MSLTFTNITSLIDLNCGTNSTSFTTANKTLFVNLGIDNLMLMLFGEGSGGAWQLDDSSHTAYPIITTDLTAGQRDYPFTTDEQGNIILDVYKVMAKDSSGVFHDLIACDQQAGTCPATMTDGQNSTGTPTHYDKTGNSIFLDLIPSYTSSGGLKIFINREASYFTSSDTTKKWGFTGLYHEYLVLYASYQYAKIKNLANKETLKRDLLEMEEKIRKHQGTREKDVVRRMTTKYENNK